MPTAGNTSWFANSAALVVIPLNSAGAPQTAVTVGVLKGVEMTPKFEIAELYGMESIKRRAVQRYNMKVDVSCKFAMWDPTADTIGWSILNGSYLATATTGVNDGSGQRNQVAMFTIVATVKDTANLNSMTLTATNVYFDSLPLSLTENEFIVRDLKGTASDITVVYS
jgi:hypothetical protein